MNVPGDHRDDLLNAARQGNDDALGELIEDFRPLLRGEALRSLHGAVRARVSPSDIVNLTWWSAFRGFPRFEGDVDAFVGWLRKLHERNIQDALRDEHAEKRDVSREVPPSKHLPQATGRLTTPSQALVRAEQGQELADALAQLPPAQREAVRLRYYDGLTIEEIIQQLGRSEQAVAGLLKRGLSRLREIIRNV